MGFWQSILGTKTYCVVCGGPIRESKAHLEKGPYCSDACMHTIERLSAPPISRSHGQADNEEPATRRER